MTEPNQNMAIWDAVSKTDPDFTKKVTQRGGFTSVNANYQIKMATEQFGPLGVGWGYAAGEPIFNGSFIMIPVTLWHGDRSNTFGPTFGCCEMLGNRPDSDAPKKAGTDALTKLLSQLGFNADIFLGQYDDNKYVQSLIDEKKKANPSETDHSAIAKFKANMLMDINDAAGKSNLEFIQEHDGYKADLVTLSKMDQNAADDVSARLTARIYEFTQAA